jgi:hypothetical protein
MVPAVAPIKVTVHKRAQEGWSRVTLSSDTPRYTGFHIPAGFGRVPRQSKEMIASLLGRLHSLLDVPEEEDSLVDVPEEEDRLIRLLHPSLREFLLDSQRCSNKTYRSPPRHFKSLRGEVLQLEDALDQDTRGPGHRTTPGT